MWERCPDCPSRTFDKDTPVKKVVPGVGNPDADTAYVGEGPGREEGNRGVPFCGKTGDELDGLYLPLAGQGARGDVYLTNACKCHWADSSDPPPDALVRSCANFHLRRELAEVGPKLVVLMGGTSNRLAGIDLDMHHGFLTPDVDFLGHRCNLFSTYHPALGMHKSSAMLSLLEDFKSIRELRELPVDKCPKPKFKRLVTAAEVKAELGDWHDEDLAVDTESIKRWKGYASTIRYTPWCATFSREVGYAFMVRVSDRGAWEEFGRQTVRFRRLLMHNSDHDVEQLRLADVLVDWGRVQDTMQIAYHDGRLPKGLKALGYRLLGSRMRNFDDVIGPYALDLQMDYLGEAVLHDWPKPEQLGTGVWEYANCPECKGDGVLTRRMHMAGLLGIPAMDVKIKNPTEKLVCVADGCKKGKIYREKLTRKQGVQDKLNRIIGDIGRNPTGVDIQERWENWNTEDIDSLVAKMGPLPLPSIDQVPEDETVPYACADAHNTLRIAPILRGRVALIRRKVRAA